MRYWERWNLARKKVSIPDYSGIESKTECRKRYRDVALARKNVIMWWVIVLMGLTITALISYIYSDRVLHGAAILKYVEFAATLLSIVLSIFAILYSYFSALEASRQWGDINTAVSVMEKTTETIEKNNETLLATVIAIHGEVNAMTGDTGGVSNKQDAIVDPKINKVTNIDNNAVLSASGSTQLTVESKAE